MAETCVRSSGKKSMQCSTRPAFKENDGHQLWLGAGGEMSMILPMISVQRCTCFVMSTVLCWCVGVDVEQGYKTVILLVLLFSCCRHHTRLTLGDRVNACSFVTTARCCVCLFPTINNGILALASFVERQRVLKYCDGLHYRNCEIKSRISNRFRKCRMWFEQKLCVLNSLIILYLSDN